ncbi:MAG: response regulator [Okeania sp. SIO2H7]|nr:response regulator [Okeania sp. SIO2H7]
MATNTQTRIARFINYLVYLTPKQFSGQLKIVNSKERDWKLYFESGRLVWAEGGIHPWRRWHRHLRLFCPDLVDEVPTFLTSDVSHSWQYYILVMFRNREQISIDQTLALIESTLVEVLFDLIQEDNLDKLQIKSQPHLLLGEMEKPLTTLSLYEALEQVKPYWDVWCKAELLNYSPNLAPLIKEEEKLKNQTSPLVYERIRYVLNKKKTLRDLAVYLKQDVFKITRSLMVYIKQKIIELVEVEDISPGIIDSPEEKNATKTESSGDKTEENIGDSPKAPLIACVDDSALLLKVMRKIITKAGYEFIGIQKSLLALSTLIEKEPDVIFLDIEMPIINGYEICAQIRRIPKLKDTPVVILTGRDGIMDKIRAKLLGSSEFITKPVEMAAVLSAIEKYTVND